MGKFTSIQSHLQADFFFFKIIHFFCFLVLTGGLLSKKLGSAVGACMCVCVRESTNSFFPFFCGPTGGSLSKEPGNAVTRFFFLSQIDSRKQRSESSHLPYDPLIPYAAGNDRYILLQKIICRALLRIYRALLRIFIP